MSDGPFRDALGPAIADAERQLAELRQQRTDLERRYAGAQMRLDSRVSEPPPLPVVPPREPIDWPQVRKSAIVGALVGLLLWLPMFLGR